MESEKTLLAISRWFAKRGGRVLLLIAVLIGCLLVAALVDPRRAFRAERKREERRMLQERDLVGLATRAKGDPAQGPLDLDFNRLGFVLPPEALDPAEPRRGYGPWLPEPIKAYDGRNVRIRGYLLPTHIENGFVSEGLLLANRMACCYGIQPRFCDFIVARFEQPVRAAWQDDELLFDGKLRVKDVFERGYWVSLYSMENTRATR